MKTKSLIGVACSVVAIPLLLSTPGAHAATPAASVNLMTWYQHADFSGATHTVTGNEGTCDTAGYSVTLHFSWAANISAIKGHGNCNTVRVTNRAKTAGETFNLPVSLGGTIYNDNVGHIKVFNH